MAFIRHPKDFYAGVLFMRIRHRGHRARLAVSARHRRADGPRLLSARSGNPSRRFWARRSSCARCDCRAARSRHGTGARRCVVLGSVVLFGLVVEKLGLACSTLVLIVLASTASPEFRLKEAVLSGLFFALARRRRLRRGPQAAAPHLAGLAGGARLSRGMDLLNHLALGFSVALTPINLMYALVGALLGTLIGVLPGIGPVATIAMLLPTTYALQPVSALIMLAGIYYGAQYGGSTTSILINMPGETSSAVTCLDGHQMALQGQAGAALATAALGSFFAGCVSTVFVAAFSPPLSELALKFGPAEYFSLMVLGLIGAVVLAHGSLLKAIAMIVLGLLLGIVGTDVNSGVHALRLRHPGALRRHRRRQRRDGPVRLRRDHHQSRRQGEARRRHGEGEGPLDHARHSSATHGRRCCAAPGSGRCSGSCPAAARCSPRSRPTRSRRRSRRIPSRFGKGAIQGVAGPESANNAGAQTSFIPLLTLGIPENAVMALMVGAMTIHNIQPGPQVMTSNPDAVLGPDRVDVGRQPDAGRAEPAADRHLDQAAAGALPHPLSRRSCCSARSASTRSTTRAST